MVAAEVGTALDGAVSGTRLTPGWAEALGQALGAEDAAARGKSKKAFVRSPEARMKMKLAQRARRAREHGEVRR